MLKWFLPDEHVHSIVEITPEKLQRHGIKGIITDLDNTLIAWDKFEAPPELIQWFAEMKKHGISITIVSNNKEKRVKQFSDSVELPFIYKAKKPMTRAFQRAICAMNVRKEKTVIIGDQLLTDVFGGNRLGVHTILVVPIARTDGIFTRFNRKMEQWLLAWMKRKGMIYWED